MNVSSREAPSLACSEDGSRVDARLQIESILNIVPLRVAMRMKNPVKKSGYEGKLTRHVDGQTKVEFGCTA